MIDDTISGGGCPCYDVFLLRIFRPVKKRPFLAAERNYETIKKNEEKSGNKSGGNQEFFFFF